MLTNLINSSIIINLMKLKKNDLKINLTIRMEGEAAEQMNEIRNHLGMKSWSDVLRYIIRKFYREEIKNEKNEDSIQSG